MRLGARVRRYEPFRCLRAERGGGVGTDDSCGARPGDHADRHGRRVRRRTQRGTRRARDRRASRSDRAHHEVRPCLPRRPDRRGRLTGSCPPLDRAQPASAQGRRRRSVHPPSRRPGDADRGDGRRDGRARRRGKGPSSRVVRARTRDAAPGACGPPHRGDRVGVLAVDARCRGGGAPDRARAGDRLHRVQPARAWLADRCPAESRGHCGG